MNNNYKKVCVCVITMCVIKCIYTVTYVATVQNIQCIMYQYQRVTSKVGSQHIALKLLLYSYRNLLM